MGSRRVYQKHRYEFGTQVLALRTRASLTQTALANAIAVHRRSIQNWETGASYPKAEALQLLIAVFLHHHAFTAGQEHAEAYALWQNAAHDGSYPLAPFDETWFTRTLTLAGYPGPAAGGQEVVEGGSREAHVLVHPPAAAPASTFVDWGEGFAAPTLYGRERELETLQTWVVDDHCRVVSVVGLGGIGKSSLALTLAQHVLAHFDVVLFRSLLNGPLLGEVLEQAIGELSNQPVVAASQVLDTIAALVQLFRERRCLLVLDNFESILQPGAIVGTYRTGYADYSALLHALSAREHQSCLILTSREKPVELGLLEGRTAPVRTFHLRGLDTTSCRIILEAKDIAGTAAEVGALARLYGGNPLALTLVAEPIRELFGGEVGAFLATGDAFFNGMGKLLEQQFARSTPVEQAILYWLAIERELLPLSALLANIGDGVPQRELLSALESLRRRMLIERAADRVAFTLQPVILEYVTDHLIDTFAQELAEGHPQLLYSHAIMQATGKEYVRHTQERLLVTPLLERLGSPDAVERQLLTLLASWRDQPLLTQGYGPGNLINLLRVLRGHLRGLDLAGLAIRQAYMQGVEMQDTSLAGALIQNSLFTETFDAITAVAISSSGEYWAAASTRGDVRVWAAGGLTLHRMWRAHTNMIWTLMFSPDGRTLSSGSWDGTLKLWDVASGSMLWSGQHTSHVNNVPFAPNGKLLASSGDDGTVRIWDVPSGAQLQALPHPAAVDMLTWSPDGRLLASSDLAGCIRLWELPPFGPAVCVHTLLGHTNFVNGLAFAPNGHTLASASWDGTVKLWDVDSAQLRQTLEGHTDRVTRVVWSPDGLTLASAGRDQTIWLWDVEMGNYRAALRGHTADVHGLAFTPDGRNLLSASQDGTLRVWDIASRQCIRVMQGYAVSLFDVDWSPDGSQLICGGSDDLVTIFAVRGSAPPRVLHGHAGVVAGVGWSVTGRWFASSEWENAIRLWDATSAACLQVLQHPEDSGNLFCGLAWSPDGQWLAIGTWRRGIYVVDATTLRQRWVGGPFPTFIRQVAWSPDGAQLAGGGDDGRVYVWDAADGTLLKQLAGHHSMVTRVAWSPAGTRLASSSTGSAGGELFVWDAQHGERLRSFGGHPGGIYAVAWGSSEHMLISGGGNGKLRWWDVQSGECVRVREAHQGTVQSLRRSPDGTQLASCGDDGAIMLWNLYTGEHLQTLRRDRPYERMDIGSMAGIGEAQRMSLLALGAVIGTRERPPLTGTSTQSVAAGTPAPAAPNAQLPAPTLAISLPFQPTAFVGRSAEVSQIAAVLADPHCRLLTLIGPGGIGKTRLALAVAATQTAAFAGGVVFVALAAVNTPNQLVSAIGDTLRLSFAGQADPLAHLLGYLRERHMLLILDTFEQLLDGAELVSDILAKAPQVTMLLTSRERLNLQAEKLFDVKGLAYPPHDPAGSARPQRSAAPTDYSAVQLFVQRATQIQRELALSESALTTIVRICQQLAGMPLAIELAAASLRTLSLAEIEGQIRANLDILTTTFRDVPARHRSLRAVFDHSWNVLSADERTLFSQLAVFRGGWTLAAATAVLSSEFKVQSSTPSTTELRTQNSELSTLLTALLDKSLVYQASAGPNTAEAPRFMMLEPIREYALERLAARSDAEAIRQRHAHYFTTLADAAATEWNTSMIEAVVTRQRREYDNMRAALQWALDTGNSAIGLGLAQALWRFWRGYGSTSEGRAWLEQLLALDEQPADPPAIFARRRGLHAAAWLASDQHDFGTAARLFEQSMALRRALGETEGETDLLINAARQARVTGDYRQATALLEDVLAQHRALVDRTTMGSAELGLSFDELGLVLRELGLVLREQGEFTRAAALFAEALALHRAIDDRASAAFELLGLADVARDQGDAARVREYGEPSLAMLRELGIEWAIGFALNTLAQGTYYAGDLPRASALIHESVALFRDLRATGSLAEVLITLGSIARVQGDRAAAYAALLEALECAWAVGPRLMAASALEGLASVVIAQGQTQLAVRCLAAASALREQMGVRVRPVDQATLTNTLLTAQAILGADAFAAAWAAAQALPLAQVISAMPSVAVYAPRGDH